MLPAEWSSQEAVILTWPHSDSDWAESLNEIESVYSEIAYQISRRETVILIHRDAVHRNHIQNQLTSRGIRNDTIQWAEIPSNDTWVRDYGPLTLYRHNQPVLLDFCFDGWGNKYDSALDNRISRILHERGLLGDVSLETIPFVLEGGSIDSDGQGALLTTRACLLVAERNQGISRTQMESRLFEWFDTANVLWLNHGYLAGDDTDSHVDNLARFCNPETIAYTSCDNPDDEHYASLKAMETELKGFRRPNGKRYELIPLPIPQPIYNTDAQRLPASYANFLIINKAVLIPTFNDANDDIAMNRLSQVFTDRTMTGIDSRPIIQQHGGIHCMSMQLPLNKA